MQSNSNQFNQLFGNLWKSMGSEYVASEVVVIRITDRQPAGLFFPILFSVFEKFLREW